MSAFKTVALPKSTWEDTIAVLDSCGTEDSIRLAALIREQITGAVKVTPSRSTVRIQAPRGGDVRDAHLLK